MDPRPHIYHVAWTPRSAAFEVARVETGFRPVGSLSAGRRTNFDPCQRAELGLKDKTGKANRARAIGMVIGIVDLVIALLWKRRLRSGSRYRVLSHITQALNVTSLNAIIGAWSFYENNRCAG
jgi:hypothetical protein